MQFRKGTKDMAKSPVWHFSKERYQSFTNCNNKKKILMSNFLEINFVINIHAKKSQRFDLSEAIFKCE